MLRSHLKGYPRLDQTGFSAEVLRVLTTRSSRLAAGCSDPVAPQTFSRPSITAAPSCRCPPTVNSTSCIGAKRVRIVPGRGWCHEEATVFDGSSAPQENRISGNRLCLKY
jgi:hypothetical protein